MKLADAAEPIRAALQRLIEAPAELRCFVIIEEPLTGRFVQFCTPPPPSGFVGRPEFPGEGPLIFDGSGIAGKQAYEPVQERCEIDEAVFCALEVLEKHLPGEAELHITEESTRMEAPS